MGTWEKIQTRPGPIQEIYFFIDNIAGIGLKIKASFP